jgi:hypothetical protein
MTWMTKEHVNAMTDHTCSLPRNYLIGYQDGTLAPAALEMTEAHLHVCPDCRAWLDSSIRIDRLLREHLTLADDPRSRADLRTTMATLPPPGRKSWGGFPTGRLLVTALLVLLVVAAGFGWSKAMVRAGESITGWFREVPDTGRVYPEGHEPPGTVITVSTVVVAEPSLPYGLALTEGGREGDDFWERPYRNEAGLAIIVSKDWSGDAWIGRSSDEPNDDLMLLHGREVLPMPLPFSDLVGGLSWADGDALYFLFVIDSPENGLPLEQAATIMDAVMAAEP